MITEDAARIIGEFPLGTVASLTPDGRPAASPKGTLLVLDEMTLAYGDIRSPGTATNLRKTAMAEVVFVDVFRRKGVRIAGSTEIVEAGSGRFTEYHPRWVDTWGDLAKRIKALVLVHVDRVRMLSTPPYDDGVTEAEMIALYKSKYAELFP